MHHLQKAMAVLVSLFLLSACGGGGGSSTTPPTVNDQSTNSQTIGGTVRGLSGALVLTNGDGQSITITEAGDFSFDQELEQGDLYDISIVSEPETQECELNFSSGQVGASNVRNIEVECSSPVTYTVQIDIPITLVGAVVVSDQEQVSLIEKILGFFVQPVFAEPLNGANIQVVSLNPDGTIAEIYNSISSTTINDGVYEVILNSPPRVDLAFLVSKTNAVLGQTLPEGIYSIASESNVRIDVASTVAVDKLLDSITTFDSLTTAEVSAVINKAQSVTLADPSNGQSLQSYINDVAEPTIDPVIASDIDDFKDIDRFSMEYLAGRTLYNVWFGGNEDANGNPLPNDTAGIDRLDFSENGTLTITSLTTGRVSAISYQVDVNGRLSAAGEVNSGSTIVCGGTDQYIKTHYIEDGEFDNTDLFFFNEIDAQSYVSTLTEQIPPCESALSERIIGSWLFSEGTGKRNVLTFLDDSRYMIIHEHDDEPGVPGSQTAGSVEYGNYSWNQNTDAFSVSLIDESDGWGGLYDGGSDVASVQVSGNALTMGFLGGDTVVFTRAFDNNNPLVGAWIHEEAFGDVNVLTFLSNSDYVIAHTANSESYPGDLPQALSGEFGTYTLNGNVFTPEATLETDGDGGLYNAFSPPGGNTASLEIMYSGDLLFDKGSGDQTILTRAGY